MSSDYADVLRHAEISINVAWLKEIYNQKQDLKAVQLSQMCSAAER